MDFKLILLVFIAALWSIDNLVSIKGNCDDDIDKYAPLPTFPPFPPACRPNVNCCPCSPGEEAYWLARLYPYPLPPPAPPGYKPQCPCHKSS